MPRVRRKQRDMASLRMERPNVEKGGLRAAEHHPVNEHRLNENAREEHTGDGDDKRQDGVDPQRLREERGAVGADDDEFAVREVGELDDAENHRHADAEEGVHAAQQDSVDEHLDNSHASVPSLQAEVGLFDFFLGSSFRGAGKDHSALSMTWVYSEVRMALFVSCSTSTTVAAGVDF